MRFFQDSVKKLLHFVYLFIPNLHLYVFLSIPIVVSSLFFFLVNPAFLGQLSLQTEMQIQLFELELIVKWDGEKIK